MLVALGDSYISGEGAPAFYPGTNVRGANECRRAPSAYAPRLVSRDTDPDFDSLIFLACSGAKTLNVDAVAQHPNEPIDGPSRLRPDGRWEARATQLEQLDDVLRAVPRTPREDDISAPPGDLHGLVLISLGGNDAGFGDIAGTCLSLGNCADVAPAWHEDLTVVDARLDRVYGAPQAEIGPNVPVLELVPQQPASQ